MYLLHLSIITFCIIFLFTLEIFPQKSKLKLSVIFFYINTFTLNTPPIIPLHEGDKLQFPLWKKYKLQFSPLVEGGRGEFKKQILYFLYNLSCSFFNSSFCFAFTISQSHIVFPSIQILPENFL
ncbi:MAG: hypothetical protein LBQ59_02675 [Candidatus Peribacteria bacterium]|nr:hypothetical protein [Candidatus Peribacteria bacterium]